jgi:AraC-like DNA-binding protein
MVEHNIGGGADSLVESYERYLPSVQIARFGSLDGFRWSGRLAAKRGRALWCVHSNAEYDFRVSACIQNTVFVSMPEIGGIKVIETEGERIAGQGQAIVLHTPDDRDNRCFGIGDHAHASLKWSLDEAGSAVSSVFDEVDIQKLPQMPVLDLSSDRGEVIRRLFGAIARDLISLDEHSTLASELMNEAVLRLLFEPLLNCAGKSSGRSNPTIVPRAIKKAIDYMRANAGEPIRIRDVADACCVTPRTLENGFRDFKNTTPIAYLRQLRLLAVRRDLMNSEGPARISEIARRWGFVDLGRFAERYRREFGELPSETVRKR